MSGRLPEIIGVDGDVSDQWVTLSVDDSQQELYFPLLIIGTEWDDLLSVLLDLSYGFIGSLVQCVVCIGAMDEAMFEI